MGKENAQSYSGSVKDCLGQVRRLKSLTGPIVERIKSGDLKEDFLEKVRKFLVEFNSVYEAFGQLHLEDDKQTKAIPEQDRRKAIELFPELIQGVEELAADQAIIIGTLQIDMQNNADRMEMMRKAKKIFNKFIKGPKQEPKFFDVKG
jgi:hypothetical protein